MTNTWQSLISGQANPNDSADQMLIALPQMGVLKITGDDAPSFLQNLLTNDVDAIAIQQSQLSGLCNAKGRLIASFLLIRHQTHCYYMMLPSTMCQPLQQRLAMYVLRAKVTINNISDATACIGLYQKRSDSLSKLSFPDKDYQCNIHQEATIIKLPDKQIRYVVIQPHAQVNNFLKQLDSCWQPAHDSIWQQLDIKAGLPMIYPASSEKFTPQQVNFDLIDGVSFSKGCYPGQEVVARLHYLGKESRRMFIAKANSPDVVDIASNVTDAAGNVVGHVVAIARKGKDALMLLVSLRLANLNTTLFVNQDIPINVNTKRAGQIRAPG